MNDDEARRYLELINKSKLATKLFEAEIWNGLDFTSLECAALAAWRFITVARPDIAVGLYPDLWKPEYQLIIEFFDETGRFPGAVFCPNCGKGWLIPEIEDDVDSPADCTYCQKHFTSEELNSLDI